jgi:TrmH family RNA methyltransferase
VREAGAHLRELFATPAAAAAHGGLVNTARAAGVAVRLVDDRVLATLAGTVSPQGLVGVADLPLPPPEAALAGATLAVVLVEARDPGNVGTVVRTADAAGADAVLLTAGSADPRNPKAVRASAGSLFHLPVVHGAPLADVMQASRDRALRLVATTPHAGMEHTDADLTSPVALVFGNEAHGLPPAVVDACDTAVRVPILGRAESLNLAATVAVLCYEAARQRRDDG